MAVSGFVCALFTSALVLAQVPKPAAPPTGAAVEQKVEKVETKTAKPAPQAKGRPPGPLLRPPSVGSKHGTNCRSAAMAVAANRDNIIQQFTTQGRPMVRAELIFVRHICKLDREKFRQINRDAGEVLQEVVTKMVDGQFQPRVFVGGRPKGGRPIPTAASSCRMAWRPS